MTRCTVLPYFASEHMFFVDTGYTALGEADLWKFELGPSFCRFGAVPAYGMAFPAYRDTVIVNGKIVFVYGWPPLVGIQVNERNDPMFMAVFIIRHGIMCGV